MKKNVLYIVGLLSIFFFAGCSKNKVQPGDTNGQEVVFSDFSPKEGGVGTELYIHGDNFGEDASQVQVWVNNKEAEVLLVTPTRIRAKVAAGSGSGEVKIRVGETVLTVKEQFGYGYVRNVYTIAGTGEAATVDGLNMQASIHNPLIMAYDKWDDALFFLQGEGDRSIRRMKDGKIETLFTTKPFLNGASSICFSLYGDTLFIGNDDWDDIEANPIAVGIVTRAGGFKDLQSYIPSSKSQPSIVAVAVNPVDGSLFTYHWQRYVFRYNAETETCEEMISKDQFKELTVGQFPDADGNMFDIGDEGGNYGGLAFSPDGRTLYWNGREPFQGILRADYNLTDKTCSNLNYFAGNGVGGITGGQGTAARLDQPHQMAVDAAGNLFVTTRFGHDIRKITPDGYVSTYAGTGWAAGYLDGPVTEETRFNEPYGIAVNAQGDVYVGEFVNQRIRLIKEE